MQKTTLISVIAMGLLVSNFGLVAYIWRGNNQNAGPRHQPGGPRNLIIERLRFDAQQVSAYQQLIDRHRAAVLAGDNKILILKNALYSSLATSDATKCDSLLSVIVDEQRRMEEVHYHHFAEIKKLCRPNQIIYFNELAPELAALFGPPPHRPR